MNEDLSFLDYFSNFIVDLPAPGVEIGFDVLTAISLMIGFLGFFLVSIQESNAKAPRRDLSHY